MKDKEIKKVEKELKKRAKKIKVRKYSEVIKEIGPEIGVEKKRKISLKWASAIIACCFILTASIIIPIVMHKDQAPKYCFEDLGAKSVQEEEFYDELEKNKINCVDFSKYYIESYALLQTQDFKTVGGAFDAYDKPDEMTMIIQVEFFNSLVKKNNDLYKDYDLSYSVNGIKINYKLSEHLEEDGIESFTYKIKAEYNEVVYFIDYTSLTDNIILFLDNFFS